MLRNMHSHKPEPDIRVHVAGVATLSITETAAFIAAGLVPMLLCPLGWWLIGNPLRFVLRKFAEAGQWRT